MVCAFLLIILNWVGEFYSYYWPVENLAGLVRRLLRIFLTADGR